MLLCLPHCWLAKSCYGERIINSIGSRHWFITVVSRVFQIRINVFSHARGWYSYLSIKRNRDKLLSLEFANSEHPIWIVYNLVFGSTTILLNPPTSAQFFLWTASPCWLESARSTQRNKVSALWPVREMSDNGPELQLLRKRKPNMDFCYSEPWILSWKQIECTPSAGDRYHLSNGRNNYSSLLLSSIL